MNHAKQSSFTATEKRAVRLLWREALRAEHRSDRNVYECYGVGMALHMLRVLTSTVKRQPIVDDGPCLDGAMDRSEPPFSERLATYKQILSSNREHAMITETQLLKIIREIEAGLIKVVPTGNDEAWGHSGIYAFVTKGRTDDCNNWSDGYEFAFFSDGGGWDYCEYVISPDGNRLFDYMRDARDTPDLANYSPDSVAAWTAWGIDPMWGEWSCNSGSQPTGYHSSKIVSL
jgi:hypothetical protein